MKRIYILICAVVLLMSGCSQTAQQEINEINEISEISSTENLTILEKTENLTILERIENLQTSEETTASVTKDTYEAAEMKTPLKNESTFEISTDTDILLSVKNANSNSLELEICNKTPNTIFYGQWYVIEKQENNAWYQLQEVELEENVAFGWEDILYSLKADNTTVENENWIDYYGSLPKGNYRIVKDFCFDGRKQDEGIYVACEFTITELEAAAEGTDEADEMKTPLKNESTLEISATNDFTISAEKISPTGVEMKISNNSSKTLYWGSWFTVEKKENDNWYEVKLLDLESDDIVRGWTGSLAYLNEDETRTIECKWELGYGTLSKGDYRIVKDFFFDERKQDEKIYVACEFTIE